MITRRLPVQMMLNLGNCLLMRAIASEREAASAHANVYFNMQIASEAPMRVVKRCVRLIAVSPFTSGKDTIE